MKKKLSIDRHKASISICKITNRSSQVINDIINSHVSTESTNALKQQYHIQRIKNIIEKPKGILLSNGNAYSLILPRVLFLLLNFH